MATMQRTVKDELRARVVTQCCFIQAALGADPGIRSEPTQDQLAQAVVLLQLAERLIRGQI